MKTKIMRLVLGIASLVFTAFGVYLFITRDITNSLLSLIIGELIYTFQFRLLK